MNNDDHVWILMARKLSNEASEDDRNELLRYLEVHPDLHDQFERLAVLLGHPSSAINDSHAGVESAQINHILKRAEQERSSAPSEHIDPETHDKRSIRSLFTRNLLYIYAAASLVLGAFFIYTVPSKTYNQQKAKENVVIAKNGSRTKILLSDGTSVWLNGGSKLFYDLSFSGPSREVRLEGEAYFDVVKSKKPFIVHAGEYKIKVLGTAFNVKSYTDDVNIEATLIRGKIELMKDTNNPESVITLRPNQKIIIPLKLNYMPSRTKVEYKMVDLDAKLQAKEYIETAWIYNRIEFRGENFIELSKKLERWYNVKIEFEDEKLKNLKFNGSFEKETVEEAFNALQKVAHFSYIINGSEIYVKSSQ
ncbi:FecR family protein [Arcticibacter eurypsychrophilus]|uniref:FecR family protein n=1 Tax=Arcticibacter eurypsychrophilus TaxID=1434752 RepID=UPI00084CFC98|nr:FecR family protein [Arcticibacter eurypsychrophilus]